MRIRPLKIAKFGCLGILVVLLLALVYLQFFVVPRVKSKEDAYHAKALQHFREFLAEVGPEAQFESDTCGLHTLRVIYKAYGLEPDHENLRARLGVDVPTNPMDPTSTGTLQPDLLRVLTQDGFLHKPLDLSNDYLASETLTQHLDSGNMAALLIARKENGNMHWVAAYRMAGDTIEILDSLFEESYTVNPSDFINQCVLSCILVEPSNLPPGETLPQTDLFTGSDELFGTIRRYLKLMK